MESSERRKGRGGNAQGLQPLGFLALLPAVCWAAPAAELFFPLSSFILLMWLFALGAVIGSFLNVVVYRLPAGKSLIYPGSYCPTCNHPIRWYDNVPVLGWLILGGRCRDCRTPISPRYPIVEAITGGIFAVLAVVEFVTPGVRPPVGALGTFQLIMDDAALHAACGRYGCHVVLLSTLLAAALIERDGQRVPWRLGIFAAVVGVLVPLAWLHPLAELTGYSGEPTGVLGAMEGIVAGLLVGLAAWRSKFRLTVTHFSQTRISAAATMPAAPVGALIVPPLVGLFLGWRAVLVLAVVTTALDFATTLVLRRLAREKTRFGWNSWWVATTLAWILFQHP
jgi:prepilin signal peptidase PulO-like enzyme (type II secretory pathway)